MLSQHTEHNSGKVCKTYFLAFMPLSPKYSSYSYMRIIVFHVHLQALEVLLGKGNYMYYILEFKMLLFGCTLFHES